MSKRKTTGPRLQFDQIIIKNSGRTWGLIATISQAVLWTLLAMFYATDLYYYGIGLVLFPLAMAALNVVTSILLGKDPNERY